MTWTGGFGVVGLGVVGEASRTRTRPDLCADHDHPGVTYHPQLDRTWCLCGDVVRDGYAITTGNWPHKADCCGGPLVEEVTP